MRGDLETKPLFVLVDQSVKGPGGHHYEYANRILAAAEAAGLCPLLLAHRSFRGAGAHEVRAAFALTFWDNWRYYEGSPRFTVRRAGNVRLDYRSGLRVRLLKWKRRLIYSSFGLASARARHVFLRDILFSSHLAEEYSSIPSGRALLLAARLIVLASDRAQLLRRMAGAATRRVRRVLVPFALIPGAGLVLIGLLWSCLPRRNPARRFASELKRALRPAELRGRTALVFVPNATAAEMEGLALLASRRHPVAAARWAFLFRRPVFSGYPQDYARQRQEATRSRLAFVPLMQKHPELDVHFYTDTDELTDQYNFLQVSPFSSLPVPVDVVAPRETRPGEPLTIGYLGDARDEKGFQHLPRVVGHFATRAGESRPVKFLFQSNYNTPAGEPESCYARGLLAGMDPSLVELANGPFDSAEYLNLLSRMDIVLIPYDAKNYSARSSGVLMEAVAGRRPVVVPACSWMAGLAEPFRRRHFETAVAGKRPLWRRGRPLRALNDRVLPIDVKATHVLFRLTYNEPFNGYVRISLTSINEFDLPVDFARNAFKATDGVVVAMFRKRPSEKIWWKAEPIEDTDRGRRGRAEISLYGFAEQLPLAAGIAIYDRPEDIPSHCADIVDHFDHHRQAMDEIATILEPLYSPDALIDGLLADPPPRLPRPEAPLQLASNARVGNA